MKELEIAPFFITRYFIDLDNMQFTQYFDNYSEVLAFLDEAKKCYKLINQRFESDVYIIVKKQYLSYKVIVKLLQADGRTR